MGEDSVAEEDETENTDEVDTPRDGGQEEEGDEESDGDEQTEANEEPADEEATENVATSNHCVTQSLQYLKRLILRKVAVRSRSHSKLSLGDFIMKNRKKLVYRSWYGGSNRRNFRDRK